MNEGGTGSVGRLLALIGEHPDSIRAALDDGQHALLLARLKGLAEAAPDDTRAVRRALQGVRLALLPLPLDHPVRRELESVRLTAAPPGPTPVSEVRYLMALLTGATPAPAAEAATGGDPRARLLQAPALSADEARARCGGAAPPPELIRLPDLEHGDRYPEFQFVSGESGTPREVVLEVNRVLLADIDPWGAASWWLGGNSWLGGTPASLLGRLPDRDLVGAATALVEGD